MDCNPQPPSTFTNRYARWPSRAALDAGQPPTLFVLSSSSPPLGAGHDYQGITAAGCSVYAAWASAHLGDEQVYVSPIRLCAADSNGNGLVDAVDPPTYGLQYAAQQPIADLDGDGLITAPDYAAFMAAYSCGSCPP